MNRTYKTWTDIKGKKRIISDMETSHILNCIKLLQRKIKRGFYIIGDMGWEAEDRWAEEVPYDHDEIKEMKDRIKSFEQELSRRQSIIRNIEKTPDLLQGETK